MTEWRERDLTAYENIQRYNRVSDDKTRQLADCMDYIFEHYTKDAAENCSQSYEGYDKGRSSHNIQLHYSDVDFNMFQEAVITNTHVSLRHTRNNTDAIREAYDVILERDVALERKVTQATDVIFSNEIPKSDRALVEYYSIERLAGGEYKAYVAQLHDVSSISAVEYVNMTMYDLSSLVSELDKIADLYASYNRERAIMEK